MLGAETAAAQETPARPTFELHRFDEDWRPLCDPARRTEPLDALKCVPLADDATLTLGGEWRERIEAADEPGYGLRERSVSALLHHLLLDAELRVSDAARAFVQLGWFDQTGRNSGAVPSDVDRLDVTQAFVDVSRPLAGGRATLRGGRQELSFGSSRLIAVREGPNVRRSFDGGRAFWIRGAYLTGPVPSAGPLKVDLYYLGYRRGAARFAAGIADERRHPLGVRLFGEADGFDGTSRRSISSAGSARPTCALGPSRAMSASRSRTRQ